MSQQTLNPIDRHHTLSLQEKVLAEGMYRGMGSRTVDYVLEPDGSRTMTRLDLTNAQVPALVERFRRDPKESLGTARESLFAIMRDTRLDGHTRRDRLDRYLDAYISLNLRLDRAAFPEDGPGVVHRGVPDYLPDGFTDMGSDSSVQVGGRYREQIVLDKVGVFNRYRSDIMKIFASPYVAEADNDTRKRMIIAQLMMDTYYKMPYTYSSESELSRQLGGGRVNISEMHEGVCRHQAMTLQALAQFFGISTRLFKNDISTQRSDGTWSSPGKHAANLLRINGRWSLIDATQPDQKDDGSGIARWKPGTFRIDGPPLNGEERVYEGVLAHSKVRKRYRSRSDSYWRIER